MAYPKISIRVQHTFFELIAVQVDESFQFMINPYITIASFLATDGAQPLGILKKGQKVEIARLVLTLVQLCGNIDRPKSQRISQ